MRITKRSRSRFPACRCSSTTTRKPPGSRSRRPKPTKSSKRSRPTRSPASKFPLSPTTNLFGYVYQLPKSTGVFPGGIFSLYTGYSVGVRGAIHPPSTPFPEACVKMYEALKAGDLKGAQKEHDLLTRLMQVVGKYLTHPRPRRILRVDEACAACRWSAFRAGKPRPSRTKTRRTSKKAWSMPAIKF